MPNEDDRFSDVAEQLKQTGGDDGQVSTEEPEPSTDPGSGQPDSVTDEPTDCSTDGDALDSPPFTFDETDMHGFYVRNETWEQVTQMRSSVTAVCSMFDVPEFEGREFQDACLRVIAEHGDEVALQILQERGIEPDQERIEEVVALLRNETDTS